MLRLGSAYLVVFLALSISARAQTVENTLVITRGALPQALTSRSGQFIVRSTALAPLRPALANLDTNWNYIILDPMLLPVSCDRLKEILNRQIDETAPWRGRIYVTLHTATSAADPIDITSERFRDGWRYLVELPNLVEKSRYINALVQVLLLEIANRSATERSAEIPAWLTEGFSRQLLAGSNTEMKIILPPPSTPTAGGFREAVMQFDATRNDPLANARAWLRAATPLTFQELSWPTAEQVEGSQSEVFGCSAQLFVKQLLALNDGQACMRTMLASLPSYYNWQFAFLRAYKSHFQRPLDVEKWWALQVVHFTGREMAERWLPDESLRKLDEIIHPNVLVRTSTNQLPLQGEVALQTVIREWDNSRQTPLLQTKLGQLNSLRLRVDPAVVPLLDEYRQVLIAYLQNRDHHGLLGLTKGSSRRRASNEAVRELDALDARRAALSAGTNARSAATTAKN